LELLKFLHEKNSYIGPETLKRCFGEIGEIPPLTDELLKELESLDPQNLEKKKKETHILALIPDRIGKKLLTLNILNEFKNFKDYWSKIKDNKEYSDKTYFKTSWVLMTKDVLKGSKKKKR